MLEAWRIGPLGPLCGEAIVPGDKSISHRAVLFGALASGPCSVRGLLDSADVRASIDAVRALGANVESRNGTTEIRPPSVFRRPEHPIDCGNSGTTIRLLTGILAADEIQATLTGDASLQRRPMGRIIEPLRALGVRIRGAHGDRNAPLTVQGPALTSAAYELPIASAQVKSCLLLATRGLGGSVKEPARDGRTSRDHTERLLRRMGADLRLDEQGWLHLKPVRALEPFSLQVPGDISSAAFILCAAAAVPGSDVVVRGVGVNETRTGVIDALRRFGADISVIGEGESSGDHEPVADLRVRYRPLQGCTIDGHVALAALDELPVLAVLAAFAEGETVIRDAAELRVKESDRISRTTAGLRSLGVQVDELPDGMVIQGGRASGTSEGHVDATGDHRIAMAFAVAGLAGATCQIDGVDVSTSYPGFKSAVEALCGA